MHVHFNWSFQLRLEGFSFHHLDEKLPSECYSKCERHFYGCKPFRAMDDDAFTTFICTDICMYNGLAIELSLKSETSQFYADPINAIKQRLTSERSTIETYGGGDRCSSRWFIFGIDNAFRIDRTRIDSHCCALKHSAERQTQIEYQHIFNGKVQMHWICSSDKIDFGPKCRFFFFL